MTSSTTAATAIRRNSWAPAFSVVRALSACWIIAAVVALIDAVLLGVEGITWRDPGETVSKFLYLLLFCWIFSWAVAYFWKSSFFNRSSWFFHLELLGTVFSICCIVLDYLVASANFPLRDQELRAADSMIFFDWHGFNHWVAVHEPLGWLLSAAYFSLTWQRPIVVFLLVAEDEVSEAAKFMLAMFLCAVITTLISIVLPALGEPGQIGMPHIFALINAREHALHTISLARVTGIVTFPSFHAALGVIIAYTMVGRLWRAVIFIPLNVALIAATPTVGGHYLVDTVAGCALAAAVLFAVASWSADDQRDPVPKPAESGG